MTIPTTFTAALYLGISRVRSIGLLDEYRKRWQTEIDAHEQAEQITEQFHARRAELQAEVERKRREDEDRKRYEPKAKRR